MSGVDDVLATARQRISRLTAVQAAAAVRADGALLVDTRPVAQRVRHGEIPGAVAVERNVLEWRLDPSGAHRLPEAEPGRAVVVLCQEGYASSLAVASLVDLGRLDVHDLIGGFAAWVAAGLPARAFGDHVPIVTVPGRRSVTSTSSEELNP